LVPVPRRSKTSKGSKYSYANHAAADDMDEKGKLKNPFHKVQPVIVEVEASFPKHWQINRYNAVDEGKIPCHGNVCPVQSFDPLKPVRFGQNYMPPMTH